MNNYFILLIIPIVIFFLRDLSLKKKILTNSSGDFHQTFTKQKKVPLIGGVIIFIVFSYLHLPNLDLKFYLCLLFILILGLASDLKIFESAFFKLILQFFLILIMVYVSNLKLNLIGINFIDNLNKNILINHLFVTFCIIIITNGSNFIDGMNGLSLGYFILLLAVLIQNELFLNEFDLNFVFLASLFLILLFNLKNLLFLGDNGSYLLGSFFGFILIKIYNQYAISPFFIILLLWYPSFELLFSIIRKFNFNKSPMKPDTNHLHQLIYLFIFKKFFKNSTTSNNITTLIINSYNYIVFLIGAKNFTNSELQIFLIIISIFFYIIIYRNLITWKFSSVFDKNN